MKFKYKAPNTYIAINAEIGDGAFIEQNCQIGHPSPSEFNEILQSVRVIDNSILYDSNKNIIVGKNAIIRSGTVIYSGVVIGDNFDCGHMVYIREYTKLGNNVYIMAQTAIGCNVKIGDRCRIMGRITDGCVLENDVISLGILVGDRYSGRAGHPIKHPPIIRQGAVIGANATVLEGVEVGEYSFIGAGAVVSKDVDPYSVAIGVPAKRIKDVRELPGWSKKKKTRKIVYFEEELYENKIEP